MAVLPVHAEPEDVEELLRERGVGVSYETVRCWIAKFAPQIAANLRRHRLPPLGRRPLDKIFVWARGRKMWLWRAVDDKWEAVDVLVQKRRKKYAALKLRRTILRNSSVHNEPIITEKLPSYGAAVRSLSIAYDHRLGRMRENN